MSLSEKFGHLINPDRKNTLINIDCFDLPEAKAILALMMKIRVAENTLATKKRDGHIGGPVHLGVGQEAIAAGLASFLNAKDYVFGAHRSHAHLLSLNPNFYKLFAEVLGKQTGFSKGMGGSMHLWDQSSGFYGAVPIVAGTVPIAVGAGLSAKMQKTESVAVCYLGDGAVEEGVVHESMNLASIWKLPVIFVVENNLFASHMHLSQRQPSSFTARFAAAHHIEFDVIDGNDVGQIYGVAQKACDKARRGEGPYFIESFTYRWYGHVDWREDIDVGVNRSVEDVAAWRLLDPVMRLHSAMMDKFKWSQADFELLEIEYEQAAQIAWEKAVKDPHLTEIDMLSVVYEKGAD